MRCILIFSLILSACVSEVKHSDTPISAITPKYAKGFKVLKLVDQTEIQTYYSNDTQTFFFKSTPKRIICLSATHIGAMCLLNARDRIIGVSSVNYIYDSILYSKKLSEVGESNQLNIEKIVSLKPDLVILFSIDQSTNSVISKLKQLNIPYIINSEFMEKSPLAQAEWIKFFGALTGEEKSADSIFQLVENNYHEIKNIHSKLKPRPRVLINIPWRGTWYMSGKNTIIAQLINDAGGEYVFSDLEIEGTSPLEFEKIFSRGKDADYWIHLGIANQLSQVQFYEKNAPLFKAFKLGNMYNNDAKVSPNGGNDIWESGVMRPDLVLKDLSSIFAGDSSKLLFYRKIR